MPNGNNSPSTIGQHLTIFSLGVAIVMGTTLTDQDPAVVLHEQMLGNVDYDDFDESKRDLYTTVSPRDNGKIICLYSNTQAALVNDPHHTGMKKPDPDEGVHAEHVWACKAKWIDDPGFHFEREGTIPGADLHNLYPARGGINISRLNRPFGEVIPGTVEFVMNKNGGKWKPGDGDKVFSNSFRGPDFDGVSVLEPREDAKGNVARAMFYMSVRYWIEIPDDMELMLREWHELDAVDQHERKRNDRIESIQNNRNPFIDHPQKVAEIEDF